MSLFDDRRGLEVALRLKFEISQFEKTSNRKYLPQRVFDTLISKARNESFMKAMRITQATEESNILVKFIRTKVARVFAITACIQFRSGKKCLGKAMSWFHQDNFHDKKLPIEEWSNKDFEDNGESGIMHSLALIGPDKKTIEEEGIWSIAKIMEFQEHQYGFLALVFLAHQPNHDAWDLVIPLTARGHTFGRGSSGIVKKYAIHDDHILDSMESNSPCPCVVALEEIVFNTEQDRNMVAQAWASEVKAMAMMNELDLKGHIGRFITTFRHGSAQNPENYLIIERADGDNLRNLWVTIKKPKLTAAPVKEVIIQLLGLAEALNAAHYLDSSFSGACYRYVNLKPENILWFPEVGKQFCTLKICDWACARNKRAEIVMRHSRTSSKYGTHRYKRPEVETGSEEKPIPRLYDCWSMGGIALEFIAWLLYGLAGHEKFNQSVNSGAHNCSYFYQLVNPNGRIAQVHNAAAFWMEYMSKDPACRYGTITLGDLLEIVQGGLLVLKLPPHEDPTLNNPNQQFHADAPPSQSNALNNGLFDESIHDEAAMIQGYSATAPGINVTPPGLPDDKMNLNYPVPDPARLHFFELRDRLEHIVTSEGKEYWSKMPKQPVSIIPDELCSEEAAYGLSTRTPLDRIDYSHPQLDPAEWEFATDNEFGAELFLTFSHLDQFSVPETRILSKLCDRCVKFRDGLWSTIFEMTYDRQTLENKVKAGKCDLCGLLWRTCEKNVATTFDKVRFERFESSLKMNGNRFPVLSFSRSLGCKSPSAADLQIGFAELPTVGSTTHYKVIRKWLTDCDQKHCTSTCKLERRHINSSSNAQVRTPTRLINVGVDGSKSVRLCETNSEDFPQQDNGGWIALSHQWGPGPHFSTTTENVKAHLTGIDLDSLPATFRDAVLVTRALGRRYLWIDSICIIQAGQKADFNKEGKRMEDVYSGACCVIAATRAVGQRSGFLEPRRKRDYVALYHDSYDEAPFYVSERIDNFKDHVLDSALSHRGWVLQEHALARRTIFFSEYQTYWECGHGIRCETMAELRNKSAKLLGDPNFPEILDRGSKAERALRLRGLYQNYSRLGLSRASERPQAISSLEQRLCTMGLKGGFGIFEDGSYEGLLRRSLLWHRRPDTPSLTPIPRISVPSWSWMAYTGGKCADGTEYAGGINYYKTDFDAFDWETFKMPWSSSPDGEGDISLTAKVRDFDQNIALTNEDFLMYDTPSDTNRGRGKARCFVLGIQRGTMDLEHKRHYVLIVVPTDRVTTNNTKVYKRVGAGYLPGRCLIGDAVDAKIQ